ncbi:sensor histidine kinase [Halocola ammonii]
MEQVWEFFENFFTTSLWPKRWACGIWTDFHGWLYIFSSVAIWLAYFSIPVLLYRMMMKRKSDLPFTKVFLLFILFIFACGTTHFLDAFMFYVPVYRVSAVVLLITAIVSWAAFFGLRRVLPEALAMKTPRQYQVIIDSQTTELRSQNDQLKDLNEDLDSFVYAASHDLKSPVSNLEGLLALLSQSEDSDNHKKEVFKHMDSSIQSMKTTLHKLTEVIKSQKTPFDAEEEIDLDELIETILRENKMLFEATEVTIEKKLEVKIVKWSRIALKSVIYNLLSNSLKYKDPDRPLKITISSEKTNDGVEIRVTDNGLGFDAESKGQKVFDLFTRFHDHVEGSGIGLYMVRNLLRKKGSDLTYESEVGKGTTAIVNLKLSSDEKV